MQFKRLIEVIAALECASEERNFFFFDVKIEISRWSFAPHARVCNTLTYLANLDPSKDLMKSTTETFRPVLRMLVVGRRSV